MKIITNAELSGLLEEAARRLRALSDVPTTYKRLTAREYAKLTGRHEDTVQNWCREGILVARRIGFKWEIDVAASDRSLSLKFGNKTEKELVKRGLAT